MPSQITDLSTVYFTLGIPTMIAALYFYKRDVIGSKLARAVLDTQTPGRKAWHYRLRERFLAPMIVGATVWLLWPVFIPAILLHWRKARR